MKNIVAAAIVTAMTMMIVMRVLAAPAPDRPPGVGAAEWAPITDTLGVVLDQPRPPAAEASIGSESQSGAAPVHAPIGGGGLGAALIPPISGYLMVKRGKIWQRLIIVEPVKGPGAAG